MAPSAPDMRVLSCLFLTKTSKLVSAALELFAQSGYLGASMSDIAKQLGLTKAALYKHFPSKQAILDQIVSHMNQLDEQRARDYQMPLARDSGAAQAYLLAPAEKIRAYTLAQFAHWTQEPFSAAFRRMLTLEQYHDRSLSQLFQTYLASGPTKYMAEVFQGLTGDADLGAQLALEFYGPIYLLYALYDGAEDKPAVLATLNSHIDRFISRIESIRTANS